MGHHAQRHTVTRIDEEDLATMTIPAAGPADAIAVTKHTVWITSGSTIMRINPVSGERKQVALADRTSHLAVGGGSVWALTDAGDKLVRLDPTSLRVRETIHTPNAADSLALSGRRA